MASSVADLKNKKASLTKDLQSLTKSLNSTVADRNSILWEISMLDQEMDIAQQYYDYYCQMLEWTEQELVLTEAELAQARQDYDAQFEAFCARTRYLNENDQNGLGYLQILLSSSSISDFLNNVEIVSTLIKYDKEQSDTLKAAEELIAQKLADLEASKREYDEYKIQQEIYLAELDEKYEAKNRKLEDLSNQEAKINELISDAEKDNKSLEKLIKEAEAAELAKLKAAGSKSEKTVYQGGGVMGWPVPSNTTYISSYYGNRTHPITKKPDFHNGVDIPASKGNNVVAAENGTVIFAGTQGSYGKLVVINHGGGISTAYAHNSSIVVSVGQSVKKGQTIAKIGSTGQSTGNHCHFEVRVDGVAKDPMGYLNGK